MEALKDKSLRSPTEQICSETTPTLRPDHHMLPSLRVDTNGVNPRSLVGKVLCKITRSSRHPTMSLHFTDSTTFRIHIEGYHPNPSLQGLPKELEMDSSLQYIVTAMENPKSSMDLLVSDCALVRLTDKAFRVEQTEERWDQNHLGLAFKFVGDPAWHCVWATIVEHDENTGGCTFRSYDDVYLQPVGLRKPRQAKRNKIWNDPISHSPCN